MKTILALMLTFSLSPFAFAANWEKINNSESVFEELLEDVNFHESVYRLSSKKNHEPMINSLKQLTYIARYENKTLPMPMDIELFSGSIAFKTLKTSSMFKYPAPVTEDTIEELQDFIEDRDVQIYEGLEMNKLGDCANVYLFDKASREVALLSTCTI